MDVARQYNLAHLVKEYPDKPFRKEPFVWVVGFPNEAGTVYGSGNSKVVTLEVLSSEFFMQGDWNRGRASVDESGQLDPSVSVLNTDVYPFTFGTDSSAGAVLGPIYKWPCQYLAELPSDVLKQIYDDRDPATGRAIGDTLAIHSKSIPRPIAAISNIPDNSRDLLVHKVVMAGERSDILVRAGMGVRFNGSALSVPELATMAGVVDSVPDHDGEQAVITVSLVLPKDQLPSPGNGWDRLDRTSAFQTNVQLQVKPCDVNAVFASFATNVWQFKHDPPAAAGSAQASDLHIVGHIDLVVGDSSLAEVTQICPRNILQGLYGYGPLAGQVQWHVHRVATLEAWRAFKMVAVDLHRVFGSIQTSIFPYLDFTQQRVFEFARCKSLSARTSNADNTLHLNIDGWVFARVLHEYLDMNSCTVSHDSGVFFVTAHTWESARMFLPQGQANGEFDLRAYGHGFVELFAPIVFKWEMYDTTRTRADSRTPDGFVAITFSGYAERDRHNNPGGLKDTREHPHTRRQMYKRPSACSRF